MIKFDNSTFFSGFYMKMVNTKPKKVHRTCGKWGKINNKLFGNGQSVFK